MDAILPPRKFEIDGKFWIERVSTVPSTRLDLLALQEKFENCLKLNGAKPFGVCPIRRRIYDQLFAYGIRKALLAERQQSGAVVELEDEKKKNEELTKKVRELERQLAQEKDLKENEMKLLEQGLRDENERLREANKTLKTQLQAIIQMEQQLQQEEAKLNEDA
uniref:Uncharacterized protein n=1 Tax=Acrobeloides nanus TaxID=290746 RepID=A0A914DA54_9BILA